MGIGSWAGAQQAAPASGSTASSDSSAASAPVPSDSRNGTQRSPASDAAAPVTKPGQKLGEIAITFDDLPFHGSLPLGVTRQDVVKRILAVIGKEQLPPVTGMVNGFRFDQDKKAADAVLRAWRDAGQPIASHTWSHMNLNDHPFEQWKEDTLKNEETLKKYAAYPDGSPQKQSWKYLRFPFLGEGETAEKRKEAKAWLTSQGYQIAEVTMSWGDYAWNEAYARCMNVHNDIAIKRLHDTYLAAARQNLWAERVESYNAFGHDIPHVLLMHLGAFDSVMFGEVVAQMRADGYKFISLPQALMDPAYSTPMNKLVGGGLFEDQAMRGRNLPIPHRDNYEKELAALCR